MDSIFWIGLLQIIWIDLLLSGDNAVVIALACRGLPERQRKAGIILGAGAAVGLRVLFALIITYLLAIPLLKLIGGLLLVWIAVKLASDEGGDDHGDITATDSLWRAVKTVAIADAVMSLDNVLAIAAASHGNVWLFTFGLALTVPLIIAGSGLVLAVIERFPIVVWAGAALLGWIAGDMLVNDPWVLGRLAAWDPSLVQITADSAMGSEAADLPHYVAAIGGAVLVLLVGFARRRPKAAGKPA
jgi:YjbE family integral membrane protein